MTVRLAVYGLLRRGDSMAHLMDGAEWLGAARLSGFDLYRLTGFPGAVPGQGSIQVEVYELASPAVLAVLDEAEGVHATPPLYRRELVEVLGGPAWLYVFAGEVDADMRIASGDWLDQA